MANTLNPKHGCKQQRRDCIRRLVWCVLLTGFAILTIACLLAMVIWYDYYRLYLFFFLPLFFESLWRAYLDLPLIVFGSLATIIFAIGCCLRWPPPMGRFRPAWRGLLLLAVVFLLHGIWFDRGWVPFRPLCFGGGAMFQPNRHYGLEGSLTPEATRFFADMLQNWWGTDAVRLSGPNEIQVRPAIALFDNELNWNMTTQVAKRLAEEQGLGPFERPDLTWCQQVERIVMADGRADDHVDGWGTWPWNTVDGDGWFVRSLQESHDDR